MLLGQNAREALLIAQVNRYVVRDYRLGVGTGKSSAEIGVLLKGVEMDRPNERNRDRLAQILRDLPIAFAYVYERDRTVDDIRAEYGLEKFGELEALERLGLTTDRRKTVASPGQHSSRRRASDA